MDQTWEQKLDELRRVEPAALTDADKEFLIARRGHLSADELVKFDDILPKEKTQKAEKTLEELSEKELKKIAKEFDLDPKDFETPELLIEAIREKQAEQQ